MKQTLLTILLVSALVLPGFAGDFREAERGMAKEKVRPTIAELMNAGYKFHPVPSPPVHEISLYLYNVLFFPMFLFSSLFYAMAFFGIFSKPKSMRIPKISNWPKVTVQIPTLNEIVALRCARRCLEFDYPKNKFEVIIGDDSNDSQISKSIDEFAEKHPQVRITRRKAKQGFKAGNLNHMLEHSKGDIIVTFDSDFVAPRDFLKRVVPLFFTDKKLGCVQTKWKYINMEQNIVTRFASTVLLLYHNLLAQINSRLGVSLLFGSGQAVRKDLLIELGAWQNGSLTEDVEFSLRVLKAGYKIHYLSDFSIPGEVPFTAKGFFKQQKKWAYGNARAFLDHWGWILFGNGLNFIQRSVLTFTTVGFIASPFIVSFVFLGMLSFITVNPETIDIPMFLASTGWTMICTSGFMVALMAALSVENQLRMTFHVLAGAVTVGLYTSFGVTSGFVRAITRRKVDWYIIRKAGNEYIQPWIQPSADP